MYPSGSHGSFLSVLLNTMAGFVPSSLNKFNVSYDSIVFEDCVPFQHFHHAHELPDRASQVVNIRVSPNSYLKYATVCLNRTNKINIILEELSTDTFLKLQQHDIFKFFLPSLSVISGQTHGDVDIKYLREWARLCLFADNGSTINQWIQSSIVEDSMIIDFECFYDQTILTRCQDIFTQFGIVPVTTDVQWLIDHFVQTNRYRLIDFNVSAIIKHITQKTNTNIPPSNFMLEAWIDNWLNSKFGIDPLLNNQYFSTTQELVEQYFKVKE